MANWEKVVFGPESGEKALTNEERLEKLDHLNELLVAFEAAKQGNQVGVDNNEQQRIQKEIGLMVGYDLVLDGDFLKNYNEVTYETLKHVFGTSYELNELEPTPNGEPRLMKVVANGRLILKEGGKYELFTGEDAKEFIKEEIKKEEEGIKQRQARIGQLSQILS